jgi:hypothetical protein
MGNAIRATTEGAKSSSWEGRRMNDTVFQEAYTRVRNRHDDQIWYTLSPREITDAIYREIRLIDHERVTARNRDRPSARVSYAMLSRRR